ncbi:MAG: hypothetical protein U5Q44_11695 [Dehalococcoidia bacterium]|nr:hypothetical protein [Dehalococcoidia bacterium]
MSPSPAAPDPGTPAQLDLVDIFSTSETSASTQPLQQVSGDATVPFDADVTCPGPDDDDFYDGGSAGTAHRYEPAPASRN